MNDAREIDLIWVLQRVLRGWKRIVILAVVAAVVTGLISLGMNYRKLHNPNYMENEKLNYERKYDAWVATRKNFEAKLENITQAKVEQQEYNEKSILMKIDPLRNFYASFELYVHYDYQVIPELTYQNLDMSGRVLKAYLTYMTNGELQEYIINHVGYEIERRYLNEILSTTVDTGNRMITVNVQHQSKEACLEILDMVQEKLMEKQADVCRTIAEHTLTITNESVYESVNLTLQKQQKENLQAITDLDINLQEVNEEYRVWKLKEQEPQPVYQSNVMIKKLIKQILVAGILGAAFAVGVLACTAIFSGRLLNPEDMKNRFGLRLIGMLPRERQKKPFAFVSRWIARLTGIKMVPEDYERLAKMVGASIKSDILARAETTGFKRIVFTGGLALEEMQKVVGAMGLEDDFSVVCAPDVLTNAASIQKLMDADCVVLMEKQEVSETAEIEKELDALKAWKQTVLGAVVTNVDAIM